MGSAVMRRASLHSGAAAESIKRTMEAASRRSTPDAAEPMTVGPVEVEVQLARSAATKREAAIEHLMACPPIVILGLVSVVYADENVTLYPTATAGRLRVDWYPSPLVIDLASFVVV